MEKTNKNSKAVKSKVATKPDEVSNGGDSVALYTKLKAEEEVLDKQIAELESQGVDSNLNPQMAALHEYNEMKDIAQVVLGYLADIEQTTVVELHKLYNLPLD